MSEFSTTSSINYAKYLLDLNQITRKRKRCNSVALDMDIYLYQMRVTTNG